MTQLDTITQQLKRRPYLARIFNGRQLDKICRQIGSREIPKPEIIGALLNEEINLDLVENGLRLTVEKASSAMKRDVYGRLRDKQSVGTVFELAVLGGLAQYLGDYKVNPYPDIDCGKSMEAQVIVNGQSLYFEVTVLSFGEEDKALIEKAYKSPNGVAAGSISGTGEGRLVMKIEEKIQRYVADSPNVLVVYQGSCLPKEDKALEAIKGYLNGNEDTTNKQHWAGIFFLSTYKKVVWLPNQNAKQPNLLGDDVVQQLKNSLKLLTD